MFDDLFIHFAIKRAKHLLRAAADLQRHAHQVGGDGGVVPRANVELRVGGLGTNLEVGIAQSVADGVNADEGAGTQKIHTLKIAGTGGVELGPLAVDIPGQELKRVQGLLRGAAGGQTLHGGSRAIRGRILNVL